MKRSELVKGAAYYWARNNDWMIYTWSHKRAVVVDVEQRWELPRDTWARSFKPRVATRGQGVLVDIYHEDGRLDERTVVQASQLRGPWAEIKAKVDAARERERERDEAKRAEARAEREREAWLEAQADARGWRVTAMNGHIRVELDEFARMLERLGEA